MKFIKYGLGLMFIAAVVIVILQKLAPFIIIGALVWWLLRRRKATALDEIHGARLRGDEILREHGINPETGRPYTKAEREIEANPADELEY